MPPSSADTFTRALDTLAASELLHTRILTGAIETARIVAASREAIDTSREVITEAGRLCESLNPLSRGDLGGGQR